MSINSTVPLHELVVSPDVGDPMRKDFVNQCIEVRIAVFVHEQGFPLEVEVDEYDETATHILLRLTPSLKPIGTIRAYLNSEGIYKLGRLVVLKEYRNYKFGGALVKTLHEAILTGARKRGFKSPATITVALHAQLYVKGFYAKYGYSAEGNEFDEDGGQLFYCSTDVEISCSELVIQLPTKRWWLN